jgi:hypothetical protein
MYRMNRIGKRQLRKAPSLHHPVNPVILSSRRIRKRIDRINRMNRIENRHTGTAPSLLHPVSPVILSPCFFGKELTGCTG